MIAPMFETVSDQLGLGGAVKDALGGRVGRVFAGQGGVKPALHRLLAGAINRVGADIQRFGDLIVGSSVVGIRGIGLQQNERLQQPPGGEFPFLDGLIELLTLLDAEPYDVFLDGRLFRGHDASPVSRSASAFWRSLPSSSCCRHGPGSPTTSERIHPVSRCSSLSKPSKNKLAFDGVRSCVNSGPPWIQADR